MSHRKVQCWIFSKKIIPPSSPDALWTEEEQCLLLLTNPVRGSYWQPVTGTVEQHEGFFEAACREPHEETKFLFERPPVDTKFEFEFNSRNGHTKERIFYLFVDDMPDPVIDPKEHQNYQWISPSEGLKLLRFPSNIEGLKKAYQLAFEKELKT